MHHTQSPIVKVIPDWTLLFSSFLITSIAVMHSTSLLLIYTCCWGPLKFNCLSTWTLRSLTEIVSFCLIWHFLKKISKLLAYANSNFLVKKNTIIILRRQNLMVHLNITRLTVTNNINRKKKIIIIIIQQQSKMKTNNTKT